MKNINLTIDNMIKQLNKIKKIGLKMEVKNEN